MTHPPAAQERIILSPVSCVGLPTFFFFFLLPILGTNPRLEAPLPLYFSGTALVQVVCVAKRQQFSCPLAPLSLKFKNVVP